jgi:hypothetical protein
MLLGMCILRRFVLISHSQVIFEPKYDLTHNMRGTQYKIVCGRSSSLLVKMTDVRLARKVVAAYGA